MLPVSLKGVLQQQIEDCRKIWRADRDVGLAGVWLPDALQRKYPLSLIHI